MEARKQFTFYESDLAAFERIEDEKARIDTFEALLKYVFCGTAPDFRSLPEEAVGIYEQFRRRGL